MRFFRFVIIAMLCATSLVAASPDPQVLQALKDPSWEVAETLVRGKYCKATVVSRDSGTDCALLLVKVSGQWQLVAMGRPGIGENILYKFGVPEAEWRFFSPVETNWTSFKEPFWAFTAKERLTKRDLDRESPWGLTLMRNEIFARHGRLFQDPELKAYFESRPWYRANPTFSPTQLNSTEKYNVDVIQRYQKANGKES